MRVGPIYHITQKSEWDQQKAGSFYTAPSLETEGFIHCSDVTLILKVANAFFRGTKNLVLLEIDTAQIADKLKYEGPAPRPSDWNPLDLCPHIFGPLPISAVKGVFSFEPGTDGSFQLPQEVTKNTQPVQPFHLAIPVHSIDLARRFYGDLLGFSEGRSADSWVDWNFFGHQLVTHLKEDLRQPVATNPVDGHDVPVPHFGVVLEWNDWQNFAEKLQKNGVKFVIEPHIRFRGQVGEQATLFFLDPSGNALEFKSFQDPSQLFAG